MKNNFFCSVSVKFLNLVTAVFLLTCSHLAHAALTPVSGEVSQADGWTTARTKTVFELPVAAEDSVLSLRGKTGKERGAISIAFLGEDGKTSVNADGKPMQSLTLAANDLKLYGSDIVYPDTFIAMRGVRYFIRPNLKFYRPDHRAKVAEGWDKLPAASEHAFSWQLRRAETGVLQLWFDENLMHEFPPAQIARLRVTLAPGASLQELSAAPGTSSTQMVLPVANNPRTQGMENAKLELISKATLPEGLKLSENAPGIAVANLSIFPSMMTDDLQSFYYRRTAADNLPEQRMFSVPLATYDHASILVAAEDDPAKVDAFTLRVTRYGRSRGDALADTTVYIPASDAEDTKDAKRVGSVTYGPENARKKTALWLIRVPIKNGLIQDILYEDTAKNDIMGTANYLDVELMDPLYNVEKADAFPPTLEVVRRGYSPANPNYTGWDYYTLRPEPQTSSAHVFGIVLEKSPAQMQVHSNIGAQAFYASDKPQFEAKVVADKAGEYSVAWDYADLDGKIVKSDQKTFNLESGREITVAAPVQLGNGWYAARFRLSDTDKNELIDYRTSFVMLPPDTRKAGLESPFYGWFFNNHGAEKMTLDEIGPLLQRLGIRRVGLPKSMPESETLPKYGFTNSTVNWTLRGQGRQAMGEFSKGEKTLEEAVAMQEATIRETLELWPSIDRMLVFHESGAAGAPFPSELWGQPAVNREHIRDINSPAALLRQGGVAVPAEDKAQVAWERNWPKRIEYLYAMAKMVREKFPQLKMQYGNDGNSMGILGELFRQKFPREYIDTIASEDLGQTIAPERDMLGGMQDGWYVRELAEKMGYGDVPITATTEWIGRMTRNLGHQKQAEWKVRDGLLALAYGYDTISIAGINDASDAYYYSIWANGGLTTRYPTMAPKPAYAAVATLTRVLDQARHQRFVPTGSTVVYLQEFKRGSDWVYATWTPRGQRELKLFFDKNEKRTLIDLYGRESAVSEKEVALTASTSVQYLVSKTQLSSGFLGAASFPADKAKAPEKPMETIALESLDTINIAADDTREKQTAKSNLGKMIEGNFEIREVEDPEMGKCIEVELKPGRNLRLGEVEYATLKLAKPIKTPAKNAGVWIKGNGSWGSVDILKNHWGPWADNGNLHMSWPGDASMNFDGWSFIEYPYYHWTHREGIYATTTVSGLRISFPRDTLVGTERVAVENQKIRIKGIELW